MFWNIPSHIYHPALTPTPLNFFPWTSHEIWLRTKMNLQFGNHFFRKWKLIQKQEIWVFQPSILDSGHRKWENEGKHIFWAHVYVVAALLKELFGPKTQSLSVKYRHSVKYRLEKCIAIPYHQQKTHRCNKNSEVLMSCIVKYTSKIYQKQKIKFHNLNTCSFKVVLGFVLFLFGDEICSSICWHSRSLNLHDDLL